MGKITRASTRARATKAAAILVSLKFWIKLRLNYLQDSRYAFIEHVKDGDRVREIGLVRAVDAVVRTFGDQECKWSSIEACT